MEAGGGGGITTEPLFEHIRKNAGIATGACTRTAENNTDTSDFRRNRFSNISERTRESQPVHVREPPKITAFHAVQSVVAIAETLARTPATFDGP